MNIFVASSEDPYFHVQVSHKVNYPDPGENTPALGGAAPGLHLASVPLGQNHILLQF